MEHLSIFACFESKKERNEFYQKNIKPFAGVDKPIFSVSQENESCSTQELLEVKALLKKALPFLEEQKASVLWNLSILSDKKKAEKQLEIKDMDKIINQIKAKIKG